ncbi:MAG: hypothetical protein HRT99_02070 [Mycoplasmatales bacterium]|nr:hypothetical protein [Mycoplasmatales bacterium]
MDIINILLWTFSLLLAVAGIFFGIVASINSSRANNKLKEIISDQIVSEEAQKYFFTLSKKTSTANKKVIIKLKETINFTYSEYSIDAVSTRMVPMPPRLLKHLESSEFSNLAQYYLKSKKELEIQFRDILPDLSILVEGVNIDSKEREKLIEYHIYAQQIFSNIMKGYYQLIIK